jgi:hypothetical protein
MAGPVFNERCCVYIVSAFERVEGWEVMDSSRVLFWLQGGSRVMEREEPGCGKFHSGLSAGWYLGNVYLNRE